MHTMKKIRSLNKHSLLYLLLAILAVAIGIKIAPAAYKHEPLILGFLSAANLYFLYLLFLNSESPLVRKNRGVQVKLPRDLKHIVEFFFLFLIAYWSLGYIIDAIKYLYRILVQVVP